MWPALWVMLFQDCPDNQREMYSTQKVVKVEARSA